MREHEAACSANTRPLEVTAEVERYLVSATVKTTDSANAH